ncbi:RHS repeat-associated core domain-containing protein [Longimicrobium sp.]|uniref:RHS repeat-associated core domain-containing protein n=1 Tax=Longimicrobium sp. TaxID=2029185 RepID=UPI003B3BBFC3
MPQRRRRDSLCTGSECTSAIERYAGSGDQLLYEIRAQGGDNASATQLESDIQGGDEFGRVGYTHAAGIDAPLSVIRTGHVSGNVTLIPHSDYRGAYHAASTSNGGIYNCEPNDPCLYVLWPKPYWGSYFKGGDPAAGDWAGSLIRGQQDISGLMYRRNRYYDPMTGQFTQSDPIGIAGGLNTYGFGNGDPISYSDPYGLCAEHEAEQDSTRALTPQEEQRLRCVVENYSAPNIRAEQLAMIEAGEVGVGNYRAGKIDAYQQGRNIWFTGNGDFSSVAIYNEFSLAKIFGHELRHRHQEMITRALTGAAVPPDTPLGQLFEADARAFEASAVVRPEPKYAGWDGVVRCPPF